MPLKKQFKRLLKNISGPGSSLIGRLFSRHDSLGQVSGSWTAWIDDLGRLIIEGEAKKTVQTIQLFIDEMPILAVNTTRKEDKAGFRFNLKPGLLALFPRNGRLSLREQGGTRLLYKGEYVACDAGQELGVAGDGELFHFLNSGHFVTKKGRLRLKNTLNPEWREGILSAYAEFKQYFESTFGYKPYIICGTLLGYYREGDFIEHDDDFDVSYLSEMTSPESVKEELKGIVEQMFKDGWEVMLSNKRGFIKPKVNGLRFDVSPMWYESGTFWMLNATHIDGPESVIAPVKEAEFLGRKVYIPNDPQSYLEKEYGEGWSTPEPGYKPVPRPGASDYLKRSCLSMDETVALYDKLLDIAKRSACHGGFTVVNKQLQKVGRKPIKKKRSTGSPSCSLKKAASVIEPPDRDMKAIHGSAYLTSGLKYRVSPEIALLDGAIPLVWWVVAKNFGDLLSPWLLEKMTGLPVVHSKAEEATSYLAIGSIVKRARKGSVVWGSGCFGTEPKKQLSPHAEYKAVRGPLTRNKLRIAGISCPAVYGDPALLVPYFYWPSVKPKYEVGVVLRWSEDDWNNVPAGDGVKKIYLKSDDIEGVIVEMLQCKRIVSSSLHGLILADAYGIPNAWLSSGTPKGGEFKFYDYFLSVNKLRYPREYSFSSESFGLADLLSSFDFDGRAIDVDLDSLLSSCPFIEEK